MSRPTRALRAAPILAALGLGLLLTPALAQSPGGAANAKTDSHSGPDYNTSGPATTNQSTPNAPPASGDPVSPSLRGGSAPSPDGGAAGMSGHGATAPSGSGSAR